MYFVYIIKSLRFPRQYIGSTANVEVRIQQHNKGSVRSTKAYRLWKVVKIEGFSTKKEALQREHQIKKSGLLRKIAKRGPIVPGDDQPVANRAGLGSPPEGRCRRVTTMPHYLYILQSTRLNRLYYGTCADVSRRLKWHNNGLVKSTKAFRPWKVVKIQSFVTKKEAQQRERQIKRSGWARKQIKKQLGSKY